MAGKRLIVIDGYSLLFRAFYGTRFLSTSDGRPTNALFGLVSMLFTLLEREKPDSIVVALDAPGKTFRDAEYAEYKGTRKETPEELKSQLPIARDLLSGLGIPILEITGYEADDIVGTLAKDAASKGYKTLIVTGDTDQLQLVDDDVTVMTTRQGVTDVVYYDPNAVHQRYGFGPEYVADYKALVGDTSDNIPGVPGIGDKSATKLIQEFGHVEDIIANIDKVDEKFRKKLEPALEQLPKSKWLATIVRDAPVEFDYEPFRIDDHEFQAAQKMLESLEFRTHLKKLPQVLAPYMESDQKSLFNSQIEVIDERPDLHSSTANYDEIENWRKDRIVAVHIEGDSAAVAIETEVKVTSTESAERLIQSSPEHIALHNAKPYLRKLNAFSKPAFDTMIAAYVLQSGRSTYLIEDIAQGYLDQPAPQTLEEKASAIYRLIEPLTERLKAEEQWRVFDDVELALEPVLARMEAIGIAVDRQMLEDFSRSLSESISKIESDIYELAGEKFTIGSPQQLGRILFEKLNIPSAKKTKTGYATGAEVLVQLAPQYPIAQEILNWRELTKLKSTYADALPKMISDDGRIHTTFAQTVAATGRLSSVDPNLQNIPIRTELGKQIRRAFVAAPGYQLASLDYSQIELRLLAHECKEDALMDAFVNRKDVHAATAAMMWHKGIDEVTQQERRYAKMLNYAVLYGVTDFGLANQLGGAFTVAEAKELINNYFERFPKVKDYIERTLETARTRGYTTTIIGRRRYFPDIHAGNRVARQYAERQAINAPLQGGSADLIKIAMINIQKMLEGKQTRMILQVHDELVFELANGEEELLQSLREAMETAIPLDVPIEVDVSVGPNWLEAK
jgi:DNA polymerase-1